MPNDHLIYIAYNSASVLNMLLFAYFLYFASQLREPFAQLYFRFRRMKWNYVMQLPPYANENADLSLPSGDLAVWELSDKARDFLELSRYIRRRDRHAESCSS